MRKIITLLVLSTLAVHPLKAQLNNATRKNIVSSELDFASTAEKSGLKYAFEKNLDSLGLIVNGIHLVNGLKAYSKAKSENIDLLTWYPSVARTNSTGDFGFTTGPYLYYSKRGEAPVASGNYFSIWKKDKNQHFKLIFDGGVNHTRIIDGYTAAQTKNLQVISFKQANHKKKHIPPTLTSTIETAAHLHEDIITLRSDQSILLGKKDYPRTSKELLYQPKQSGYDLSGDMYYCVGNLYERGLEKPKGFYAQVWHYKDEWKIVADVIQLAR